VPLFLVFTEPSQAVQLVIIVTLALAVVLPGMHNSIDRPLLARLAVGGPSACRSEWPRSAMPTSCWCALPQELDLAFVAVLAINRLQRRS
jgi:hypothetical protein